MTTTSSAPRSTRRRRRSRTTQSVIPDSPAVRTAIGLGGAAVAIYALVSQARWRSYQLRQRVDLTLDGPPPAPPHVLTDALDLAILSFVEYMRFRHEHSPRGS